MSVYIFLIECEVQKTQAINYYTIIVLNDLDLSNSYKKMLPRSSLVEFLENIFITTKNIFLQIFNHPLRNLKKI